MGHFRKRSVYLVNLFFYLRNAFRSDAAFYLQFRCRLVCCQIGSHREQFMLDKQVFVCGRSALFLFKLLCHVLQKLADGQVLGTAIRAVAAGRTGDEVLAAENLLHVPGGCQLRFLKRESVSFHFSSPSSLYINSDKLSTFLKRH